MSLKGGAGDAGRGGKPETNGRPKGAPDGEKPRDGKPEGRRSNKSGDVRRLLSYLKPHWRTMALAVLSMILAALSTAAMAWLIKPLLDHVFFEKNLSLLNSLTFLTILVYSSTGVFSFFQSYFMNKCGYTVVNDIRVELFAHIEGQSLVFFHRHPSGELISRVVNDVTMVQSSVTQVVTALVMDTCKVLGLAAVLIMRDPVLSLFGLVAAPFAVFPIARFGRRLRRLATGSQEIMGALVSVLTEAFQGVRVVQSNNRVEREIRRFARVCKENVDNLMRAVTVRSLSSSLMEILGGVCVTAVIWYGGREVIAGRSTPGTFFSFMTAILLIYEPLKRLTRLHNEAQNGLSAARRVFEILDLEPEIKNPENPVTFSPVKGEVEFKNVSFSYGPEKETLAGINFKIAPGETVALAGPSGAGKTSLANLLCRFYDPSAGEILFDGADLKTLDLKFLRSQIALVSQDTILFDATAKENISYPRPEASDDEIREAARASLSDLFIEELPGAYDARIGENGSKLSGGQRQRLAIARAILKNAPVLVLDEATSALDAESEKQVRTALDNLSRGRSTLVIAHRLSTIREADRILVLKEGRIVEEGSHRELLNRRGEYYRLYSAQHAMEEEGASDLGDETL